MTELSMTGPSNRRFVSVKRRPKEDGRFISGSGRFVGDIKRPGMLHIALVTSPYPAARSPFDRDRSGLGLTRCGRDPRRRGACGSV